MASKQSLEKWLARNQTHLPQPDEEEEAPEEISLSDILCEHDALDPSKASRMKCINEVSAESATRIRKLDRKIRVPMRRFWPPDARSHLYSTQATYVQFASQKHIKVRSPWSIERYSGTESPQRIEKRYQQEHPRLVSAFNEVCEVTLDEPGFWISKPWLKGKRSSRNQPPKYIHPNAIRLEAYKTKDARSLPRRSSSRLS